MLKCHDNKGQQCHSELVVVSKKVGIYQKKWPKQSLVAIAVRLMVVIFSDKQDVNFIRNYSKSPTVLVTATHSSSVGSVAAECNGIVSWIEVILDEDNLSK